MTINSPFRIEGKTVLITGAAGGIGSVTAHTFWEAGANLILSDLNVDQLPDRERVINLPCDVTHKEDVQNMLQQGVDHFGSLDVAINNAGVSSPYGKFMDMSDDLWHLIMNVNLTGMYHALKAELPFMIKQNSGKIINVASLSGVVGSPRLAAYGASKHAVVGLTKSLVHEVAKHNITLNAICPGFIETPMLDSIAGDKDVASLGSDLNPMRRFGTSEEIAEALLWLASDQNTFMNGQAVVFDGGFSAI